MTTLTARQPLHRGRPGHVWTNGDIAAGVGEDLGLVPDTEQQWLLDSIYAENDQGLPASYEVAVVAPRQNLKSATLEIAALTDLFVFGVDLHVWTAHEFKTARKSFEDMRRRILLNPEYGARARFRDSHGEEAIFLDTGERVEFHARSGGSGRGFTCRKLTLDEAMYLQPGDLGALAPTMFTVADAQIRYGSSAGKVGSGALRAIRNRGRQPADGDTLAYAEYGAERRPCKTQRCSHLVGVEGCALDDRELWWQANCALWAGRATEQSVERQRRLLPPEEFAREFLSWWEDPANETGGALNPEAWRALADAAAVARRPLVVGVDQSEDRAVFIGCAWRRPDAAVQVMLTQDEHIDAGLSPEAALDRLEQLHRRWHSRVILGGPAVGMERELRRRGVTVEVMTGSHFAAACGHVDDRVRAGSLHHGNQHELNLSAQVARWRNVGTAGERAWQLKDAPGIGALAAVTRALGGLLERPSTTLEPAAIPATAEATGLAAMTF